MSDISVYFCKGCSEQGVNLSKSVDFPDNMVLGCVNCPIRDARLYQDYRQLFRTFRLRRNRLHEEIGERSDGEWLLLVGLNTYYPTTVEGQIQSYSLRKYPMVQWPSKTRELLFANLKLLKSVMVNRLRPLCVCLATLSRTGVITAIIAKVILLMLGNGLINKFEVFEKIVYFEEVVSTEGVPGRLCL